VPTKDMKQKNLSELSLHKSASRLYGNDFAKESRKTTTPGKTKHFLNFIRI